MSKVILVLCDALRDDAAQQYMGYLEHLVETRQATRYTCVGELPSMSRPMYETVHTGVVSSEHGVTHNNVVRHSTMPNIFELARDAGKVTAASAYSWFSELYNRAPYDIVMDREVDDPALAIQHGRFYQEYPYPDIEVFAAAGSLVAKFQPDYLLIHPMSCDTYGEEYGGLSAEYRRNVVVQDQALAALIPAVKPLALDVLRFLIADAQRVREAAGQPLPADGDHAIQADLPAIENRNRRALEPQLHQRDDFLRERFRLGQLERVHRADPAGNHNIRNQSGRLCRRLQVVERLLADSADERLLLGPAGNGLRGLAWLARLKAADLKLRVENVIGIILLEIRLRVELQHAAEIGHRHQRNLHLLKHRLRVAQRQRHLPRLAAQRADDVLEMIRQHIGRGVLLHLGRVDEREIDEVELVPAALHMNGLRRSDSQIDGDHLITPLRVTADKRHTHNKHGFSS